MSPPVQSRSRLGSERGVAAAAFLPFGVALATVALTYWTVDIVSPGLPAMQDDLALSAAGTGLIFSLLFLGRLVANLPAAYLLERTGAAMTAAAGGVLLTGGSALAALAGGGGLLFPARFLQGIGISFLVNATLRSVLNAKPGSGAAMSYFGFAATIGGVLGLQSGGYLTETYSWRAIFVLCIGLALAMVAMTLGAKVFATATVERARSTVEATTIGRASGRRVAAALILNFLVFFDYSAWVALPLYTEHHFGTSAQANANLLLVITVMHLVAAFPSGRAIRRWGGERALVVGMTVTAISMLLFLPAPSAAWLAFPLVLYGIGQVAASNAGGDIVLHLGGRGGKAVGMVRFSSDLGLVVGPFAMGVLADHFGYRAPFFALPTITLVGVAILVTQHRALPAKRASG